MRNGAEVALPIVMGYLWSGSNPSQGVDTSMIPFEVSWLNGT